MSTTTINVPSGNTVQVKVVLDMTGRERKAYLDDMYLSTKDVESRSAALDDDLVQKVVFRHIIAGWSFTQADGTALPLPTTDNDTTEDLTIGDLRCIWDAIKDEVAYLSPTFEPAVEDNPKLVATTEPELPLATSSGTPEDTTTEAAAPKSVE